MELVQDRVTGYWVGYDVADKGGDVYPSQIL